MQHFSKHALIIALALAANACAPSFYATKLPGTPAEATFVEVDGVQLHYRRIKRDNVADATRPTVVFIHGYGASLESWSAVQDALAPEFDVIAFDLKGFGWSTRPEGDYSPAAQATLIWRALAKLDITRTVLVGHSWGTSVVLAMTLAQPGRVERVALTSAYVYDEQVPSFFRWAQVGGVGEFLFSMFYTERTEERVPLAYHDPRYATQKRVDAVIAANERPGSVAAALAAARGQKFDKLSPRYSDVKQPVLLLWGDDDQVTPVRFGERLLRQLENATLVVLPQCGHMPMLEARQLTINALRKFLQPLTVVAAAAPTTTPTTTTSPDVVK
ncbi:MAG TPA: alpha/beta hydrolase [Kofleriaceae bacterium]|nr:alpha/beta hydrolase [Kofleriaceae bacterium]